MFKSSPARLSGGIVFESDEESDDNDITNDSDIIAPTPLESLDWLVYYNNIYYLHYCIPICIYRVEYREYRLDTVI